MGAFFAYNVYLFVRAYVILRCWALTQGVVTGEAPPQGCIAIEVVDNGRVYQMSVSPSGLVWDTLYAQEDWILYQAEPALYQELQALLP